MARFRNCKRCCFIVKYAYDTGPKSRDTSPTITRWLDATIGRSHALIPKVREIAEYQIYDEVTTVSIRGRESTGKTTLATIIAHLLHKELANIAKARPEPDADESKLENIRRIKRGYCVRLLGREDLQNFAEVIKAMPKMNRILVFDDLSYMGSSQASHMQRLKKEVTEVRHVEDSDFKTIMIFNFHSTKALDPFLRDTHFIFQTSVSTNDFKNLKEVYGTSRANQVLLNKFMKFYTLLKQKKQITISLADGKAKNPALVTYKYNNPFRIALFYNQSELRMCVFPTAKKLGVDLCPICNVLHHADNSQTALNCNDVCTWVLKETKNADFFGRALRMECIRKYGKDPIHNHANQYAEIIRRLVENGILTFEEIFNWYGSNMLKKPKNSDDYLSLIQRPVRVTGNTRRTFAMRFGIDGLKAPGDKPLSELKEVKSSDK